MAWEFRAALALIEPDRLAFSVPETEPDPSTPEGVAAAHRSAVDEARRKVRDPEQWAS